MGRITKWEYTSKENNLGLEGSGQSWIIQKIQRNLQINK